MIERGTRRELVLRLLAIAHGGPMVLALGGCGAKSGLLVPRGDGASGGAGGATASGGNGGGTFDAGSGGTGGTGGSGGTGGISFGGSGGTGGSGGGIFDASVCDAAPSSDASDPHDAAPDAWQGQLVCVGYLTPDGGPCPSACATLPQINGQCQVANGVVTDVLGGPYPSGSDCCYDVAIEQFPCYVGRTFFIDEGVVTAQLRPGRGWSTDHVPDASALDAATRRALGEAWARDGLFEHASVASFSRFAMQLLALGAPAELVRQTLAANLDEVNHAEMCFALASAYLGEPVEAAALPLPRAVPTPNDLAEVAFETAMEGCIGETVAALQALDALERTTDPAVRAVLEKTVVDESRHAELAWRFMAWALEVGDARVHDAVARAFAAFRPPPPRAEDLHGVDLAAYAGHGRQTAPVARAIAEGILRDVVGPCANALLAKRTRHVACGAGTAHRSSCANRSATAGARPGSSPSSATRLPLA